MFAVAVEDHPVTQEFARYTAALCATSDKYANYKVEEVKIGCLGATHATHGMSCIFDSVPCDIQSISKNGKMSQDKLFEHDQEFKAAVMQNINYKVLRWEVHAVLPKIASIIMSGLNTEQHIGEGLKYASANIISLVHRQLTVPLTSQSTVSIINQFDRQLTVQQSSSIGCSCVVFKLFLLSSVHVDRWSQYYDRSHAIRRNMGAKFAYHRQ